MTNSVDRQWFYDALPKDADDDLYQLADAIFDLVSGRLAARGLDRERLAMALDYHGELATGHPDRPCTIECVTDISRRYDESA